MFKCLPMLIMFSSWFISCNFVIGPSSNLEFSNGHEGQGPALSIFGDSLSTGVIADTVFGQDIDESVAVDLSSMLLSNNFSMRKYQHKFSDYKSSAMTTDEDWGLRHQIARKHSLEASDIPVFLFSKWGGRTDHLKNFYAEISSIYSKRRPSEYVLIQIGANDFCGKKTPEEFARDYRLYLTTVLSLHPDSDIMIANVPPLPDIVEHDFEYSRAISCKKIRRRFCERIYFKDASEDFAAFNQVIEDIVLEFQETNPRIKFSNEFSSMTLSQSDLSFDCFHPSKSAHKQFGVFLSRLFNS